MIVRADSGGLGNQTWEMARHLKPDALLVIHAQDAARGRENLSRYAGLVPEPNMVWEMGRFGGALPLAGFAAEVDVVLTVECTYVHRGFDVIREAGARSVLYANPELYDPVRDGSADATYLPTRWHRDRLGFEHLPMPVALDRFTPKARKRDRAKVFYHPTAPAMLDRNGTDLVLESLQYVRSDDVTVMVRGRPRKVNPGKVNLRWLPDYADDYWDSYPVEADALLLPRRYGGLSLSIQDAAALGMPSVVMSTCPYADEPFTWYTTGYPTSQAQMKGGVFDVNWCAPDMLAATIDTVADQRGGLTEWSSGDALVWAAENSWDNLVDTWREKLGL